MAKNRVAKFRMLVANAAQPVGVETNARDVSNGLTCELPAIRRDDPRPADDLSRRHTTDLTKIIALVRRVDRDFSRLDQVEVAGGLSSVTKEFPVDEMKRLRARDKKRQQSIIDSLEKLM